MQVCFILGDLGVAKSSVSLLLQQPFLPRLVLGVPPASWWVWYGCHGSSSGSRGELEMRRHADAEMAGDNCQARDVEMKKPRT
jgi:hypothetical protein